MALNGADTFGQKLVEFVRIPISAKFLDKTKMLPDIGSGTSGKQSTAKEDQK